MEGKCYVVATPIGNLGDLTVRAIETLKEVDIILAEDTRHTKKLLDHYSINVPLLSYRDQNHDRVYSDILHSVKSGSNIALVSDAGTPLISDPGFKLIRAFRHDGIDVVAIPGASSVIAALSISGIPTDRFFFLGFLPKKPSARIRMLTDHMEHEATVVLFESPYRVIKLLQEIVTIDQERIVVICKDLTKLHEKVMFGTANELYESLKEKDLKGEYVVCIAKAGFNT
ncbi:16S rRNA (cytidine(1402)-2'-O)-methyltransferase [Candidatus Nomurabacteria bacterium]|uniref:Ribosomal RNA small subunit methyltransferase I n=1 Tax=Candidatus Dojkabacteria bacterium TaxID=2099670 RepID=A0A955I1S3_9BACT|nr:16S rRNA (cytidine(1402)-2'-O)-methyltransferase [Candidatus Dojkabacteria bacterium]MCB9789917.1 16S rRNA (cytidine(1402)-2'-O)-methyltransferase [Candidatus Nomurabacteria bacterium]MCB9803457.1 16S rRNA (cytidine(1402)-2'-O)-methyltransferase [Candidatus Nomurabacteria bacterium]